MDHNESVRKFEYLMLKQADHAHDAETALEALVSLIPSEKSRQLATTPSESESQTSQGVSRPSAEGQRELESSPFEGSLSAGAICLAPTVSGQSPFSS